MPLVEMDPKLVTNMVEPSAARIVGPLEIEDIVEKYVGLGVIWLKQVESIN